MNGIDNDMSVNGLCIRMRCNYTLTIGEGFFRIGFGIRLHHKRIGVVCLIGGEFEMIILSLVVVRIFPEPRRRFFELSRIVLVYEKVLHVDVFRLILSGNVTDCHIRHGFACRSFQKRHFSFPQWRRAIRGMLSCTLQPQTISLAFRSDKNNNFAPLGSSCCLAV